MDIVYEEYFTNKAGKVHAIVSQGLKSLKEVLKYMKSNQEFRVKIPSIINIIAEDDYVQGLPKDKNSRTSVVGRGWRGGSIVELKKEKKLEDDDLSQDESDDNIIPEDDDENLLSEEGIGDFQREKNVAANYNGGSSNYVKSCLFLSSFVFNFLHTYEAIEIEKRTNSMIPFQISVDIIQDYIKILYYLSKDNHEFSYFFISKKFLDKFLPAIKIFPNISLNFLHAVIQSFVLYKTCTPYPKELISFYSYLIQLFNGNQEYEKSVIVIMKSLKLLIIVK